LNAKYAQGLRESFRACLVRQEVDQGDLFIAELIMGELISNVVRHAPGYIDASYEQSGCILTLRVRDSGEGYTPYITIPAELSEDGRGLYLIRALGGVLSVTPTSSSGSCTTVTIGLSRPLQFHASPELVSLAS
jgi:anti-sigma regulatory factor (Ser/Thr protein kinase)